MTPTAAIALWTWQRLTFWTLVAHRRKSLVRIAQRAAEGRSAMPARGVIRTHASLSFLDDFAACGAAVSEWGGQPEDVNCRACRRLIRAAT